MSDDDEDEMEKTQIFLPGGSNPVPTPKPATSEDDTGVLLKANAGDKTQTSVDFDITAGSSETTTQPRESTPPPVAASSSSSGGLVTVIVIAVLAGLAFLLLR